MTPAGPGVPSLDDEVLYPILDRPGRRIRAVKLDDKGHALHRRLSTAHVLDKERAACTASPICDLSAVCGRCG